MHICPHCNKLEVKNIAARWSSAGSPAICGNCEKLSHVISSVSSAIFVFDLLIAAGTFLLAAALTNSFLFSFVISFALTLVHNRWAWKRIELSPIFPENAANARKAAWFVTLAWIASIFIR